MVRGEAPPKDLRGDKMLPAVEIRNVSMRFFTIEEETIALKNLSMKVDKGEFLAIIGPSGCGKSTLLSLISSLIVPTEGEVNIFGRPAREEAKKIGYMLQQDHLFPWRTIIKNVLLGPEIKGMDIKEAKEKAIMLLEKYGLKGFINHYPREISGGMRQRVALIRTLIMEPEILLLDEPFSALDYQTRLKIEDEIGSILREEKKTVILITHDISEAVAMADRVLVLSQRPGKVKSEHKIVFSSGEITPLKAREEPEFRVYFNEIFKELDIHV